VGGGLSVVPEMGLRAVATKVRFFGFYFLRLLPAVPYLS
jgi:hypothetical protein